MYYETPPEFPLHCNLQFHYVDRCKIVVNPNAEMGLEPQSTYIAGTE